MSSSSLGQDNIAAGSRHVYLIDDKYIVIKLLGRGAFGDVYLGQGPSPRNEMVAIKFERLDSIHPQLRHEYKVYRHIASSIGLGFLKVRYFGKYAEHFVMVMDLVGPSLETLFNCCQRRFSLRTVLQLADQMLLRLQDLHAHNILHRDIKPDNFAIGLGEKRSVLYCLDLGMSALYRDKSTNKHRRMCEGSRFHGTIRYCSVNNHCGIRASRRDDLESVGYILVYFLKGSLPWQQLVMDGRKQKSKRVWEAKRTTNPEQLCDGLPPQFATFLTYVRGLAYEEDPDIPYLRSLFRTLYEDSGLAHEGDMRWDWEWSRATAAIDPSRPTPRGWTECQESPAPVAGETCIPIPTPIPLPQDAEQCAVGSVSSKVSDRFVRFEANPVVEQQSSRRRSRENDRSQSASPVLVQELHCKKQRC